LARKALTRYQRLRDEAAKLRAHRNRFGRTDVPYDHEQHLRHAGDEAQRQWHEANRQMEEVETQRDAALDEYFDIRGFK
jgi:phage shock protein A